MLLGEPRSGDRPIPRSVRDWAVDVIAFLLSIGFGWVVLIMAQMEAPVSDRIVLLDLALGSVACLSLWGRRRWPVQVGLLTAVLGAVSMFASGASTIGLFTVAVHRKIRMVGIVTAANIAAALVLSLLRPEQSTPLWLSMVIGLLVIAVAVAWGMLVRARRQVLISLRDRAERAESEQRLRVAQARQLERTRIAREMHDVLAHRISLISLHAGALEFSAGATAQDAASSAAVIRQSAHEALGDLREILGVLRTEGLGELDDEVVERPQPTLTDLPWLVEQSRLAGLHVTLDNHLQEPGAVPTSLARTVFRVVQEGLTNAHKHAPHTAVVVLLDGRPGPGLDVEIRNRGSVLAGSAAKGQEGEAIPGAGQGLAGLVERTTLIGGRLEHGRTPDGDFRLHAWLPWPT